MVFEFALVGVYNVSLMIWVEASYNRIHRKRCDINSYWTQDGRIIVKPTEQSHPREFKTISTESDIYRLLGVPPYDENEFVIENESQNAD
jgi:hypothetical protein